MNNEFHYDTVRYPSSVFSQFRPDRIGAMAILHGVTPDRIDDCRVLELGCGDGSSLLSIASAIPRSQCIGVDLSSESIADAEAHAESIGLSNIKFHCMDVMELEPGELGEFDFIIAHGLFSWVPEPVRAKLLEIYKSSLARNGIGFISYNAYPGWRIRSIVRDAGRFVLKGSVSSLDEAQAALDFYRDIASSSQPDSIYAKVLESELKTIEDRPIEILFHDDLAEQNQPFYFSEFASLASNAGLAFVAEADSIMQFTGKLGREARERLDSMSGEPTRREQCFDFLRGTRFRQSLICHSVALPKYFPDPAPLDRLYFSTQSRPADDSANLNDDSPVEFTFSHDSSRFSTNFGFIKMFLGFLASKAPARVMLSEFLPMAQEVFSGLEQNEYQRRFELFRWHLLELFKAGIIELTCYAPRIATSLSECPQTFAFAKWQVAQESPAITTDYGRIVPIASNLAKQLILEFDGTRTVEQVTTLLGERYPSERDQGMLTLASVREGAEQLLKFGIMVSNDG